jgi:hypothetical protein
MLHYGHLNLHDGTLQTIRRILFVAVADKRFNGAAHAFDAIISTASAEVGNKMAPMRSCTEASSIAISIGETGVVGTRQALP